MHVKRKKQVSQVQFYTINANILTDQEPNTTHKKIGQPKKYASKEDILAAGQEWTRKFCTKKKATQRKETQKRGTQREPIGVQNAAGQDTTKTNRHRMGTRSRG